LADRLIRRGKRFLDARAGVHRITHPVVFETDHHVRLLDQ
jgi:hypothetical protein